MPLDPQAKAKVKEQLTEAKKALAELEADIREARTAGIDVTEYQKEAEDLKRQINRMSAVYGG